MTDALITAFDAELPVQIAADDWKRPILAAVVTAVMGASGRSGEWSFVEPGDVFASSAPVQGLFEDPAQVSFDPLCYLASETGEWEGLPSEQFSPADGVVPAEIVTPASDFESGPADDDDTFDMSALDNLSHVAELTFAPIHDSVRSFEGEGYFSDAPEAELVWEVTSDARAFMDLAPEDDTNSDAEGELPPLVEPVLAYEPFGVNDADTDEVANSDLPDIPHRSTDDERIVSFDPISDVQELALPEVAAAERGPFAEHQTAPQQVVALSVSELSVGALNVREMHLSTSDNGTPIVRMTMDEVLPPVGLDDDRAVIPADPLAEASYAFIALQQPVMVHRLHPRPTTSGMTPLIGRASTVSSLDLLRDLATLEQPLNA